MKNRLQEGDRVSNRDAASAGQKPDREGGPVSASTRYAEIMVEDSCRAVTNEQFEDGPCLRAGF